MKTTRNILIRTYCAILTLLALTFLAYLLAPNAKAFEAHALVGQDRIHQAITGDAVAALKGYYLPNARILLDKNMWPNALEDINIQHPLTDSDHQGDSRRHFDNESFLDASYYLITQKQIIIDAMLKGHDSEARMNLGCALHCLQDFYAHSNFIERGNKSGQTNADLGWNVIYNPPSFKANHNVTCLVLKDKICLCCPWPWPKRDRCKWWTMLTWPYNGLLGGDGLTTLTTGWSLHPFKSTKVWHGDLIYGRVLPGGLNKDCPGHGDFDHARLSAVNATVKYLKDILDAVDNQIPSGVGIERALRTLGLEGDPPPLSVDWVIDNSADMGSQFDAAKAIVHRCTAEHLRYDKEPTSYLLQMFDYTLPVPAPYTTADGSAFLSTVDSKTISGATGLCPKPVFHALASAIAASGVNALLTCFSGNRISDTNVPVGYQKQVETAARKKGIQLDLVVLYECSPVDPSFYSLADALGGRVLVLIPNTVANVSKLVDSEISGCIVPLLSVSGTLAANTLKEFTVPVDTTVSNVTLFASVQTNAVVAFIDPVGNTLVDDPGSGITIWELADGRVATVVNPQPGNWRIQIQGSGHFSASANAATPIQLNRFEFVEAPGPEYVPLHPIPGQPVQVRNCVQAFLSAAPTNIIANVSFSFVTASGDLIEPFVMTLDDAIKAPGEWVGSVEVPSQPFKVVVNGLLTNGFPFQRVFSRVFQLQSVEVRSLQKRLADLTPGVSTHIRYLVTNLGAEITLNVGMSAGDAIISNLTPTTMTLATGGTNIVEADILLPAGADRTQLEYITVTASCADDPTVSNGTVDEFVVGPDYVGDTTISSSDVPPTLSLARPEMITNGPAGGNLVLVGGASAATLDLNGNFETINGLVSQGVEANTRVTSDYDTTLIVGDNDATGTFGGQIMNAVAFVKIGNGIQTLTGTNTYTNHTTIVSGTLALGNSGSVSNTSEIRIEYGATFDVSQASGGWTLNAGQTLTGGGAVTGSVTAASGSWIEAGYDGSALSFSNNFTLNGGKTNGVNVDTDVLTNVVLVLWVSSTTNNAPIAVASNLTLNDLSTVAIAYSSLPPGRYRLITYGGTLAGSAGANLALFCFPDDSRQQAVLDDSVPGEIDLLVGGSAGNLTWVGDGVLNNWDETTTNWFNGASVDRFFSGDAVTFDDSGSRSPAVNLVTNLVPGSILVNATGTYTFAGSGDIETRALVKTNTGTLVLANSGSNTFAQLEIAGGTVQVGNGGITGDLGLADVVNNGKLVFMRSDAMTFIGSIGGTGSVVQAGSGRVVMTSTNNYSGITTVSNGVLEVNGYLAGGGAVVAVGGILRGDGIISGPVTVQPNASFSVDTVAILEPTNAAVIAINNTLSLAGTVALGISRTNSPNSQCVIGITTVTYGGTLVVTNGGPALQAGDTFTLFVATNYVGAFATLNLPALDPCLTWTNRLAVDGSIGVVMAPPLQLICATNKAVCPTPCPLGSGLPVEIVLRNLTGPSSDGDTPWAGLLIGRDGLLYGTTMGGGNHGTVFKLRTDGTGYTVLYTFPGQNNGQSPYARMVQGSSGALYGTAVNGGSNGVGTVFTLSTNGTGYTDVHHFLTNGIDGQSPIGSLMVGSDGMLFGTTYLGGTNGAGTVFKLATDGSGYTVLHHFSTTSGDGYCPQAGVVQGSDGMLYGTTLYGYGGYGTVYKLGTNGSGFTRLHNFNGNDGAEPLAGLLIGSDGMLYGTTSQGGNSTNWSVGGVVFVLSTTGTGFNVLHSFSNTGGDGWKTQFGDSLVEGCDGAIYGTTYRGGSSNLGTVFRLNKDGGGYEAWYSFAGPSGDGSYPYAGLVVDSGGTMYGTTSEGGSNNLGTVFRLDSGWSFDLPTIAGGCCSNTALTVLSTVVTNYMYVKAFTRTWRASDCASNNASCSQTVTLLNTNAALVYKANNAIPLNEPASWVNNVVPGVADSAVWEATVTGPNTTNSLGANLTWGGVKILNPGGPVRLTGGNSLTLNGVSGTGIDMSAATHDLTIDCGLRLAADQTWDVASGRTLTVNGAVDGAGSLAISDQGVVILNGTNTYAGVTTVSNGVLEVNGLLAGGGTVTAVGGILRGDGIISGPVTVQPNARLSVDTVAILEPTNAAVLAINNTLSLAGTAFMAINRTTAPNSQRVIGITTVTYGGTLLVTNVGPALQAGDTFTLFGATNYSGAFTTLNLPALDPCLAWTNRLAVNGSIAVVANPPTASAGGNQTICSGSDTAGLGGSVGGGATGGIWTSAGTGVFLPDDTTLNASYSPSFDDMLAGSVTLTLTSTGQLAPCPAATAPVVVAINAAAGVSTGGDQTICAGNCTGGLGGSVNGCATNGLWTSSGSGAFAPNATTLNATYCPSAADMAAGSVTLRLTSSGPCAPCPDTTVQVVVTVVTCSRTNRVQSISNNHNGTFTLNFVGTPGAKYYVVASGSIKAHMADWLLVVGSTNTASGPSGTWSCVVSNPVPAYYRPVAVNPAP